MKATKLVAVLAAAGLVLAACGDDDDDDAASTDTTAAEATDTTAAGATDTTAAGATDTTAAGATDTTAAGGETTEAGSTPAGTEAAGRLRGPRSRSRSSTSVSSPTSARWTTSRSTSRRGRACRRRPRRPGSPPNYIETAAATDYANNIGQFVDDGANVIVTAGSALTEATAAAAADNPDVTFIGIDQIQATPICNLTGLVFAEDKAGFLAGALAGLLTESDTIASVLGTDQVPPVVAFGEGFENGAAHTNEGVQVITTYHPGGLDVAFTDPEWGATTARQALDNGADIVFGAGGLTGNGALTEVAKQEGALCIGVDTDQWETVPDAHPCLVTSAMKLINEGVQELVAAAVDGIDRAGQLRRRRRPGRLPRPGRPGPRRRGDPDGRVDRAGPLGRGRDRLHAVVDHDPTTSRRGAADCCRTPSCI